MSMDTFSLLDDERQFIQRTDLTLEEKYETRLLRVDRGPRTRQDPLQRWFHQRLRSFRYWRLSKKLRGDQEGHGARIGKGEWSYQNTDLISSFLGRLVMAIITIVFLIVPLWLLSTEPRKGAQIVIISVSVLIFSGVVTSMLRASNLEMIIVTAAYAAILSVFVSNTSVAC